MRVTYGAIVQDASGRFGGTVHSNWKGRQLVRRFRQPTNPDTVAQQGVRNIFRNLTRAYSIMPSRTKASWDTWVVGKPLIARNKLVAVNVPLLQGESNWSALEPTPGDSSTLPPAAFVPTGDNDQITTVLTAPAIPTGWSIANAVACCIPEQGDPVTDILPANECQIYEGADATSAYTPTITGLPAGDYYVWGFIEWLAPDGSTRYSASLSGGLVTVT